MPWAGLLLDDQELAGGARDGGEAQARRGDEVATREQGNAAPSPNAGKKLSGVAGKAKWPA